MKKIKFFTISYLLSYHFYRKYEMNNIVFADDFNFSKRIINKIKNIEFKNTKLK